MRNYAYQYFFCCICSAGGVLRIPFLKNELRQFIEEKQQLLQQVRLPTRQGSRPYSTPTYRSVTRVKVI